MKKITNLLMLGCMLSLTSCFSRSKSEIPDWTYTWNADSSLLILRYSAIADTSNRIATKDIVYKLDSIRRQTHMWICRGTSSSINYSLFGDEWRSNVVFHFNK